MEDSELLQEILGSIEKASKGQARLSGEHLDVRIHSDSRFASDAVAEEIIDLVRKRADEGKKCVLGLATGSTPMQIYRKLVKAYQKGLSFRHVVTFNLDEYYPMEPDALQSYHLFMQEHLFKHIDILPENIHIPDGAVSAAEVAGSCEKYEADIWFKGGIDLQLLGLGRCGHIGFNERGSSKDSFTRVVELDNITRIDAASDFFGVENVPRKAITMGLRTILNAGRIIVVAFGENKVGAVADAVEGPISNQCAASHLQAHGNTLVHLDLAAASGLKRQKSPWVLKTVAWNDSLERQAVIWLAQTLRKTVTRLQEEDYWQHSLSSLLAERGPYQDINLRVFDHLQSTITRFPGSEPPTQGASKRKYNQVSSLKTEASEIATGNAKRILIMSPHPDDDVISCGGTFIRLVEEGHDVSVAYQTSGSIAVSDEEALRFAEFAHSFGLARSNGASVPVLEEAREKIRTSLQAKRPGEVDSKEVQQIKSLIRSSEARSAARVCGCNIDNLHFLDMPFYETGAVVKKPLSKEDIDIVVRLFREIKPQQLYAAGDLSDPHGTHRTCLQAIMLAIEEVKGEAWFKQCQVWLYRGAWQEFSSHEIEMAVPLSPADLRHKIDAIYRHQSQKDRAMFPGADPREFWQRAKDRNKATADAYSALGLPQYEGMEAFVQYFGYEQGNESPYYSGASIGDL